MNFQKSLFGRALGRLTAEPGPRGTLLDRVSSLSPKTLLPIAVIAFSLLSIGSMRGESATNDEVAHLPAGYTYLTRNDFRLNPEHPPLVKLVAAIPLLFTTIRPPSDTESWGAGEQWALGYRWLYHDGNNPDVLLFRARLVMLFWPLLLIVAVYAMARQLFGPRGAFIALVLTAFSPELLAHGHLVATDVPLTTCIFLTISAFWRFAERPTLVRTLLAGAALGASLVTKYSAVLIIPGLAWALVVYVFLRKNQTSGAGHSGGGAFWKRARVMGLLAISAAAAYAIIWGVYGFRFAASPDPSFAFVWDLRRTHGTVVSQVIILARRFHLFPEGYLNGFAFMFENAQARGAYALGKYSMTGFWWFFPFAFLVKTPFSVILLLCWSLGNAYRRALKGEASIPFLLIPVFVFGVASLAGNINIGLRHILPVFPLLFLLAAGIRFPESGRQSSLTRHAVLLLLVTSVAGSISAYPHFLGHFNLPSLLIWKRHEMLVDSNMDWGQNLGRLKNYMDRHGISDIKLAYFGNASPRSLGLRHQALPGVNAYQGRGLEREWPAAINLQPGDRVAISVTCLVGVFFEDRDYYLRVLKGLEPEANIGHSILVYHIPDQPR